MASPALEAIGLQKHLGPKTLIQPLDLCLHKGRVTGLLGLNGAGKSTVLRMLAGAMEADAGEVRLFGVPRRQNHAPQKNSVGYLSDPPILHDDQRVDEFLRDMGQLRGLSKKALQEAIFLCKKQCQLHDHGQQLIDTLSQGFRRRVGIAQALLHNPDILLLDEPSSGLDPLQIAEIRHLIQSLKPNKAILLSSHMLSEVHACCDDFVLLHHGKVMKKQALLSTDSDTQAYELVLLEHVAAAHLELAPGVKKVTTQGAGKYRLTIHTQQLHGFHRHSTQQGWVIQSFCPAQTELEALFQQLSPSEVSV